MRGPGLVAGRDSARGCRAWVLRSAWGDLPGLPWSGQPCPSHRGDGSVRAADSAPETQAVALLKKELER